MKKSKLLQRLFSRSKSIQFLEVAKCADALGFRLAQVDGSHHIYTHPDIPELVNLQNVNVQVKPYQVRQFLQIIERYNLLSDTI